ESARDDGHGCARQEASRAKARDAGVIIDFAAENAENLSFGDGAFDYLLCKESYHHFPKPYAALYEMIRVSRKAIILMEPHDPIAKMPLLLFFLNLTVSCPFLQRKVWKNRFSFEPVGNFVYKVSEREFEKFAAGLQLPAVAFKYINPNFYHKDNERKEASLTVWPFLVMRLKKFVLDTLMRLKIIPGQVLSAIIFKELPNSEEQKRLKRAGYKIVLIPKNPY
ncbi:MAG: methyltransferase domain-containing protein, partial [Pedobacter sp.]